MADLAPDSAAWMVAAQLPGAAATGTARRTSGHGREAEVGGRETPGVAHQTRVRLRGPQAALAHSFLGCLARPLCCGVLVLLFTCSGEESYFLLAILLFRVASMS